MIAHKIEPATSSKLKELASFLKGRLRFRTDILEFFQRSEDIKPFSKTNGYSTFLSDGKPGLVYISENKIIVASGVNNVSYGFSDFLTVLDKENEKSSYFALRLNMKISTFKTEESLDKRAAAFVRSEASRLAKTPMKGDLWFRIKPNKFGLEKERWGM